ncbi:MAG: acetylglutamate kinase, partial [Muribaculaceae bacterium]|nr:acetylglutamate kinase [Muribaculaceae bacterium]
GVVPVVAPLTHDGNGSMLNTNADTMASATACALAGMFDVSLVFCFEKAGVLTDPDDDTSVIPSIRRADFTPLVDNGTVQGGMIPKIENALASVDAGVAEVLITSHNNLQGGTRIVP